MMDQKEVGIPMGLVETVLTSPFAAELLSGKDTHDPALRLVGQMVKHTQDADWIRAIVAGCLSPDYAGNTLDEVPGMVRDSIKNGFAEAQGKETAASRALGLLRSGEMELFHTPQRAAFASIPIGDGRVLCSPVQSEAIKGWLRLRYYAAHGKPIGSEALSQVLDLLEAQAIYQCPEEEVHVRIGRAGEAIYYDTGQPDGTLIRLSPDGWTLEREAPLRFYRPPGFRAQVLPERNGDLARLQRILQLEDRNWVLLLAFLIGALRAEGPFMLMLVAGAHGSGKSKLCELVKRIIDPNDLAKQRLPKEEHTLAIQASEHFLLVYDNASTVRWDISDALCTLSTGGGFSTRKFFTDNESRTFKNVRPVVINGIGEFADRHDLLDRAIPLKLPTMPEGARRLERDIDREFAAMLPGLLCRLFDAACEAMRRYDSMEPPVTVRMADAAQWLQAAEPATGLAEGTFIRALEEGVADLMIETAINNPLVIALFQLLDMHGRRYEGTMGELHQKLASDDYRVSAQLPKTPAHLSNMLQRLAPGMAKLGLMVEFPQRTAKAKRIRIWVEANDLTPEQNPIVKRITHN